MSNQRSSIFGVGINDADYPVYITKNKVIDGKNKVISRWECKHYAVWRNMLLRCYSKSYQEKNKSYIGTTVCVEWLKFSNFKSWMVQQSFDGNHLDKDLLSGDHYSPNTCLFIPPNVNYFIRDTKAMCGLSGAAYDKSRSKWISHCATAFDKVKFLGRFDTELEAHQAWKSEKLKQATILAATVDDERIADALIRRYS
jgi:hypothetical protein